MFIRIYIKHGNCGEHFLKTITDQILVYLKHFPQSIYIYIYILRVMLTSAVRHWLRIYFRKVFISLLWEIKKAIKTLIAFFSFSIKTFFN